ncbi:hypothetical protein NHX12_009360 [Muraenolepis orangiensis]|uniref:G-protein coupled receptors family 1 profile domain-containing protein n=1 Tax=Muraenolepis orangiensis TaxID=630683 RepID=A0A9Q0IAR6_9TELE|nr:hypothetical protein NHX12_009360 [Muraenolepis orangiensis]
MFIPALYSLLFPIAVLLNSMAAWVSVHVPSTSTFMVYLKNLVLSDIIVTLMIPVEVFQELHTGPPAFHMFYCRYLSPVKYICMYISISLMGLISLDRFLKIVQPCGQTQCCQNLLFGRLISASIWVILIATTGLPTMVLTNRYPNVSNPVGSCMVYKGVQGVTLHEGVIITLNLYFWLVCVLVVVCYMCIGKAVVQSFRNSGSNNSQAKQKTKLRVFLVLVVFLVSFGPYHLVRIPYTFQQTKRVAFCRDEWSHYAKELGLFFATANICLDPILYFFLCREFSEKVKSMIKDAGDRMPKNWRSGTT